MGLPKTAFKKSQLQPIKGSTESASCNGAQRAYIVENGKKKECFFKPISETYPVFLAKLSVATSVILRSFLGERAADDRLVYDDNDNIIGTASIKIEGFKSFNFAHEATPSDPQKKAKVIPTLSHLLENNVLELLFASWAYGNDDLHPKNLSLQGLIDWDMYFYAIVEIIKKARTIGYSLNGEISLLSSKDWSNFPILEDAKLNHWATYKLPGNGHPLKVYPNVDEFRKLAANPVFKDPSNQTQTNAQEQMFTAALKALVTYQPDVLKARLEEALGNEPLNYTAQPETVQKELEDKFPKLFNTDTNGQPFINFMLAVNQLYYDRMYRSLLVFYTGCQQNIKGKSLPSFHQFLFEHPSAIKKIKQWVKKENNKRLELDPSSKFTLLNMDDLDKRYHKIWRDSCSLKIRDIIAQLDIVSDHLKKELSLQYQKNKEQNHNKNKKQKIDPPSPEKITETSQLFDNQKPKEINQVKKELSCDENNEIGRSLIKITELNNKLKKLTRNYTNKPLAELVSDVNAQYITDLKQLILDYKEARNYLGNLSWGEKYNQIVNEISDFSEKADLLSHLLNEENKHLNSEQNIVVWRQHTDKSVMNHCIKNLFNWAKKLPAEEFNNKILSIIRSDYSGNLYFYRNREEPVKNYLMRSKNIPGDERLAYIFTSGKTENGALNQLLTTYLIKDMVKSTQNDPNFCLPSVEIAFNNGTFNVDYYTKEICRQSKESKKFNHLFSANGMQAVNVALYQWVETLSHARFKKYVEQALLEYQQKNTGVTGFFKVIASGSREKEIRSYLNHSSNATALAYMFSKGGYQPTSFNTKLFNILINSLQKDIQGHSTLNILRKTKQLIKDLNPEHREHYLSPVKVNINDVPYEYRSFIHQFAVKFLNEEVQLDKTSEQNTVVNS